MCWSIASVKLLTKNIHSHHINIYVSDVCHSGTIFEYPKWISNTSTLEKWTNSVFWLWITIIGQTFNKKHSFPFQLHVLEPLVSCAILFEHVRVPRDDEKRTHGVFLHFFKFEWHTSVKLLIKNIHSRVICTYLSHLYHAEQYLNILECIYIPRHDATSKNERILFYEFEPVKLYTKNIHSRHTNTYLSDLYHCVIARKDGSCQTVKKTSLLSHSSKTWNEFIRRLIPMQIPPHKVARPSRIPILQVCNMRWSI